MKQELKNLQSVTLINELVSKYESMREFARAIQEHYSDVSRWCSGKIPIKLRAVIEICRLYPAIKPNQLNPAIFPDDLEFVFNKKRK